MRKQQKGFIGIAIIILAATLIGGAAYVYTQSKNNSKVDTAQSNFVENLPQVGNKQEANITQMKIDNSLKADIKIGIPSQTNQTNQSPVVSKLTVTSPNGGEILMLGKQTLINWNNSTSSTKENVSISISNEHCSINSSGLKTCLAIYTVPTVIASDLANTGRYSWTPKDISSGKQYFILVCQKSSDDKKCDRSDNVFTVIDPVEEADKGPIITSLTGPTKLKVGEKGTWNIIATDPEGDKLYYGLDISDGVGTGPEVTNANSSKISWVPEEEGIYELHFYAKDKYYYKRAETKLIVTVKK